MSFSTKVCPNLEVLHVQHDMLSPRFFAQKLPANLRVLLIGASNGPPTAFQGRSTLRQLWDSAADRWPVLTLNRDDARIIQSHEQMTSSTSTGRSRRSSIVQIRTPTADKQRAASEENATIGLNDIATWIETEVRSPHFSPKPLGSRETAILAASLCT
jgi:hypothetical protein